MKYEKTTFFFLFLIQRYGKLVYKNEKMYKRHDLVYKRSIFDNKRHFNHGLKQNFFIILSNKN